MGQLFLDAFAPTFPERLTILLFDHSGAHTAQRLRWPANVRGGPLPPYCPELNPSERGWRERKDDLAWEQFAELAAQMDEVSHLLQAYDAPTLQSLTGYTSLVEAIYALNT